MDRKNETLTKLMHRRELQDRRIKWQISAGIIGSMVDEAMFLWMYVVEKALKDPKMKNMASTWFTKMEKKQHEQRAQTLRTLRVKLMDKDVNQAWFQWQKDWWDANLETRMDKTIKPVIAKIADTLPKEWNAWLETDTWKDMFQAIYETDKCQYELKALPLPAYVRSALAVHAALSIASLYHKNIRARIANASMWDLDTLVDGLMFVLGIWPTWIVHFWQPAKLHDSSFVHKCDKYGLRLLMIGWFLCMNYSHVDKWCSVQSFAESVVPVKYYGWSSRVQPAKMYMPACIRGNPKIMGQMFNPGKQPKHYTEKYTLLGCMLMTIMHNKHYRDMETMYGNENFTGNNNFASDALKDGVESVMKYHLPQQQRMSPQMQTKITETMQNIKTWSVAYPQHDQTVGITELWKKNNKAGLCTVHVAEIVMCCTRLSQRCDKQKLKCGAL